MTKTVVIIDDDSDDLDILNGLLKQIDESILCVSFLYADEAIRLLGKDLLLVPDIFFIDINMPRISGPEVLRKIRIIPEFKDSKIVMYSTTMKEPLSKSLLEHGANLTMQKPAQVADYIAILKCLVNESDDPSIDLSTGHIHIRGMASY